MPTTVEPKQDVAAATSARGKQCVTQAATKTFASSAVLVTNFGATAWSGGPINFASGKFYNQAGALFDIQTDQSMSFVFSPTFYNAGLLRPSRRMGRADWY